MKLEGRRPGMDSGRLFKERNGGLDICSTGASPQSELYMEGHWWIKYFKKKVECSGKEMNRSIT